MRISDWSSDVCSSDLVAIVGDPVHVEVVVGVAEAVALAQDRFPAQAGLVDLQQQAFEQHGLVALREAILGVVVGPVQRVPGREVAVGGGHGPSLANAHACGRPGVAPGFAAKRPCGHSPRSEEHTSELQSLMRISYAVFCLKKKTTTKTVNI